MPPGPRALLLDGGMSSLLEQRLGQLHPTMWSAALLVNQKGGGSQAGEDDDKEADGEASRGSKQEGRWPAAQRAVLDAHRAYVDAGAEIITTISYQATVDGFKQHMGLSKEHALQAMTRSVQLARAAAKQSQAGLGPAEGAGREDAVAAVTPAQRGSAGSAVDLLLHPRVHRGPCHQCKGEAPRRECAQQHDTAGSGSDNRCSSRRAAPVAVAASVGPYGAYLADGSEYRGGYAADHLMAFHGEKAATLWKAGADVLAFETIPQGSEAHAIVAAMRDTLPRTPYWLSFQCSDAEHLANGERLADVAAAIVTAFDKGRAGTLIGLGVNCMAPAAAVPLVQTLAACVQDRRLHVLCYPNKGEAWNADTRTWGPPPDREGDALASVVTRRWLQAVLSAGCTVVGGCCRVFPSDTQLIAAHLSLEEAEGAAEGCVE